MRTNLLAAAYSVEIGVAYDLAWAGNLPVDQQSGPLSGRIAEVQVNATMVQLLLRTVLQNIPLIVVLYHWQIGFTEHIRIPRCVSIRGAKLARRR